MQKVEKDTRYHEAAVQYNRELMEFAEELAGRLGHEEVIRWSKSVARQHRFHLERHDNALAKIQRQGSEDAVEETEDGGETTVIDDHISVDSAPVAKGDVHSPFEVADNDGVYGNLTPDAAQAAAPVEHKNEEN